MKLFRMGVVVAFLLTLVFANVAAAQSLTAGAVSGRVTDPTGAVIANATVTLKSLDTGETATVTTSSEGTYRFSLLKTGHYEVGTSVSGFAKTVQATTVTVGQVTEVNITLEISKTAETIEVSAAAPLISTEPGVATSYTPEEVALLPAAGGDITTLAFTAPGVVVAQGTGYGNFTVNGLPGTSNLYTVNGENDMDPYFNINNSGASNLTLGSNEVQEVTITTNPYSGEYGQLSGAQVSYVTKSGTNAFHGNAQWYWNGREMNANDFFSNASDASRPFSNANQWAASVGGPVIKDRTWFFVDTEGLRFILPNVDVETVPTPAFATAITNNIAAVEPNELPAYQNMMSIYAKASAGKVLTPVTPAAGDECSTVALTGWTPGATCANTFVSTPTSFAKEWILAGRIDQKLTSKDDLFFRFKLDHGLQPTDVDPLSSNFDANSNQPAWDYQLNWRRVINSNMTNSVTATVSHYVAQFTQDAAKVNAEFPYGGTVLSFNDGFSNIDPQISAFPQGRNITQYQIIDDYSWTHGRHSLKFGANFRRYDVSDHNFFNINPLAITFDLTSTQLGPPNADGVTQSGMQSFVNGVTGEWLQQYSPTTDVPIGIWGLGFYGEDQWKVSPNFTVMFALRFEHNANPVCNTNCLSNFKTSFPNLASVTSPSPADVPYSSDFNTNNHNAFPSTDALNVSPRLSFSWAPNASDHFPYFPGGGKTVISGGIGIFFDNPAAGTLDNLLGNPPHSVLFGIAPLDASFGTLGIVPYDLSNPASGPNSFKAASGAFNVNDSYNQLSNILNPIIGFTPPISPTAIVGTIHSPQVQEWNLKVDQEVTKSVAVSVAYNGNHSINIPYFNNWWNTVSSTGIFAAVPGMNPNPVTNYGTVRTLQSGAVSNYNGLTTSVRLQYHSWLMGHFNYTYSHALDETSNGGLFPIGGWVGGGNIQTQINPGSLRANNYGNADYDIRNLFNADYVVTPPVHFENKFAKAALGGWQWSGKVFIRSGLPYSVTDGNTSPDLVNGGVALADVIAPGAQLSCGGGAAYTNTNVRPCLNASSFATGVTAYTSYPDQTRNQFRGPHYFDFDMGLYKTFQVKERLNFGLGATAFNVFNHPNFNLPDTTLGSAQFGQILGMQGVPTSPYGNFLGFDSSVRVVQLSLKMSF
jgi:Carboxypeptidase regulatory-like domain